MDIFTKLRLLREAIEEVYPVGEAADIISELMGVLEIDRASISWHLGSMSGDLAVRIRKTHECKVEEMEAEEDIAEVIKLRKYYDAKLDDLYKLNAAVIAFMNAVCVTKELS